MEEGKRIVSRRILSATTWTILYELLSVCCFVTIIHFSIYNPLSWIIDAVTVLISPKTWVLFAPVIAFTVAFCFLHGSEFGNVAPHTPNRISVIQHVITVHNGFMAVSLLMLSTFNSWFLSSAFNVKHSSISTNDSNSSDSCMIEEKLYLLLGSIFVGVYIFVTDFAFQAKYLQYPVVQQLKLIQIKEECFYLLQQSFMRSLWPVCVFSVFYFIFGSTTREYVTEVICLETTTHTLFGIKNLTVVLCMYILTFVYIFTVTAARYLLNLHLTERHAFSIVTTPSSSERIKLSEAMTLQQLPVVRSLAYLDLKLLAEKDLSRRQQLYILSQPGGHPYNWNGVISECVKLIKSYTEGINLACKEMLGEKCTVGIVAQKNESPQTTVPREKNVSMRNLSLAAVNDSLMQDTLSPVVSDISFSDAFKSYWIQILEYIYKNTVVSYFIGVIPDSRLHWTLHQAYPVIWATQGIAFITAASFKEDDYGICLKDLPDIITSLVNLHKAVIKIPKFMAQKRNYNTEVKSIKMKNALKSALERSLYKIIVTYGVYLRDIRLTSEIFQELQNFKSHLEG